MSTKHKISLHVEYEHHWIDHPLNLIFQVDDRVLNLDVGGKNTVVIKKDVSLTEEEHRFSLICKGKDHNNTVIDHNQQVIADSYAKFTKFNIDSIDCMQLFKLNGYFVGENKEIIKPTHGIWKNGAVYFDFRLPIYNWLLESLF